MPEPKKINYGKFAPALGACDFTLRNRRVSLIAGLQNDFNAGGIREKSICRRGHKRRCGFAKIFTRPSACN
jgi:hypothetical protein